MALIADVCVWLLLDTVLGFWFYASGCVVLKLLTFGRYQITLQDYAAFKSGKSKRVMAMIALGVSVYILLIALTAYLTH